MTLWICLPCEITYILLQDTQPHSKDVPSNLIKYHVQDLIRQITKILDVRVQYASCLPPHSSLRTSTDCWSSSATPRLSSTTWQRPSGDCSFSCALRRLSAHYTAVVYWLTETICRLLFICSTNIICTWLVIFRSIANIRIPLVVSCTVHWSDWGIGSVSYSATSLM